MVNNTTSPEKSEKKKQLLVIILLLIAVAAVGVSVWAIWFRGGDTTLTPDYAPQQTEENAQAIEGDDGDKMESPEGGGAVNLTYSQEVSVDLASETAALMFANPGKSNQNMVLQVVIQDEIIVQTGTLEPGYQVTTVNLLEGAAGKLEPGGYDGKFVVLYYNPDTGEKAVVNTEIPVTVTVS